MLYLLNPKVWIAIALLALLAGTNIASYRKGSAGAKAACVAAQMETERQARAQQDRNREMQRAAEQRYTVQAEARERFIVTTITEVRHATEHLASCPVGPAAVRLLNDAAGCAREDRPASCGADGKVHGSR